MGRPPGTGARGDEDDLKERDFVRHTIGKQNRAAAGRPQAPPVTITACLVRRAPNPDPALHRRPESQGRGPRLQQKAFPGFPADS